MQGFRLSAQPAGVEEVAVIRELARFTIQAGRESEFEAAMVEARGIVAQSPGFVSIEYWRGIERPQAYTLVITWDSVDDHLVGFRGSELYQQWAGLTRPFFAGDAAVDHHEPVWSSTG
jgi:heme-degrading monooxygenase HmoA